MTRLPDGPAVADPFISTDLENARAQDVPGSSIPLDRDHRESSNTYAGELLRLGQWRISVCQHGLQWLLQRRRPTKAGVGGAWDSVSYCQTRAAIKRLWRTRTGEDGAELLALLPEHVLAVTSEWRSLVVHADQAFNQGEADQS
jgi:hypothetical protein